MFWMNAFQENATEKMKMKWENIYTTLHEGDVGSAALSVLQQCLGDTELSQKKLEGGGKGKTKERIPQKRAPQLHTFKEAEVAWAITEWDNLPAWLSLGWDGLVFCRTSRCERESGCSCALFASHPRQPCTFLLNFTSQIYKSCRIILLKGEGSQAHPFVLLMRSHPDTVVALSAL